MTGASWSLGLIQIANRYPSPPVSLQAVYQRRNTLKGAFTWDIEHSEQNKPSLCLEKNLAKILIQGGLPDTCSW